MHKAHYTNQGVKAAGRLSINLVSEDMLVRADAAGCHSGATWDKSQLFAWTMGEAGTPVITMSPLTMECVVTDNYETETFDNFICSIAATLADEAFLDAQGRPDFARIRPVLFEMPGYSYLRCGERLGLCTRLGKDVPGKGVPDTAGTADTANRAGEGGRQ